MVLTMIDVLLLLLINACLRFDFESEILSVIAHETWWLVLRLILLGRSAFQALIAIWLGGFEIPTFHRQHHLLRQRSFRKLPLVCISTYMPSSFIQSNILTKWKFSNGSPKFPQNVIFSIWLLTSWSKTCIKSLTVQSASRSKGFSMPPW